MENFTVYRAIKGDGTAEYLAWGPVWQSVWEKYGRGSIAFSQLMPHGVSLRFLHITAHSEDEALDEAKKAPEKSWEWSKHGPHWTEEGDAKALAAVRKRTGTG